MVEDEIKVGDRLIILPLAAHQSAIPVTVREILLDPPYLPVYLLAAGKGRTHWALEITLREFCVRCDADSLLNSS